MSGTFNVERIGGEYYLCVYGVSWMRSIPDEVEMDFETWIKRNQQ